MKVVSSVILLWLSALFAQATIGPSFQMQLGNPSGASADTNNHDHYLLQRSVQAIDYSDNLGQPNWASWNLTASDIGTNSRSSFITDTNLPPNFTRYSTSIYNSAGWDRGHLCPSKDRTDTSTNNDLVFLMSNVLPQNGVNNSGVWLQLENYCRDLVQSTNNYELLLICGGSGYGSARLTNGPFIPDYVWKIAVVVPPGAGMATNRITATNRVIAVKIPNTSAATNHWPSYITSAAQIEVDTGLTFFTALPTNIAAGLRNKVDGQTNPPPLIVAFSPLTGATGTNVIITGTNFTAATAVTFNGVSASFVANSSTQITASVPTNSNTGLISVTTPSGTSISTNNFVVSGGVWTYSGTLVGWDMSGLTGGPNNYGPTPFSPTTNAPHLATVGLTRGSGIRTNGSAAGQAWGGLNYTNATAALAIAASKIISFNVIADVGYQVSFSSINRFDYQRSGTGATNGLLQYQLGTGAFNDITNLTYAVTAGASIGGIDLTRFGALQNIGAGTNVTFRIVNFGGTGSTGSWYVNDTANSTALDLAVQGSITQILIATNPPAAAPAFSGMLLANNQFQFTVTGTAGSNYVVQAATNLAAPNWIPLATNPAPFLFAQSNLNLFPQRFYRVQNHE